MARAGASRACWRPPASAMIRLRAAMPIATPVVVSVVRSGRRPALPRPTLSVSRQCIRAGGSTGSWLRTVGLPASSSIARPSIIRTTRRARRATSGSWVTRTTVAPRRFRSSSSLSTPSPAVESRLPVGSSARIRPGRLARARATATFCCSPPDSRLARVRARFSSPTSASRWRARRRRSSSSTPASVRGSATLSSTVMDGMRLKVWKIVLTRCRR